MLNLSEKAALLTPTPYFKEKHLLILRIRLKIKPICYCAANYATQKNLYCRDFLDFFVFKQQDFNKCNTAAVANV